MSRRVFSRAKSIFCEVVELPAAIRVTFLDQACDGDEELRNYIESLLDQDDISRKMNSSGLTGFLDTDATNTPAMDSWIGRQLVAFEIRERIGRGGMGDVYRATRTADFTSEVAVKFARHARYSDDFARRFRDEIRFQASLSQHPNIAAIREVGQTEEGIPYFIMDYVDGVRIDEYCDVKQLDIRQRIMLFRQVCDAVQFAHQNMVIHRDLKPSNILVTGQGVPILIDFGIAKLAQGDDNVNATETGGATFTPAYASPEQVRRERMTTATDIYSLGLILYELLTGHAPYPSGSDYAEIIREIVDEMPPRPSEIITRSETMTMAADDTCTLTPDSVCSDRRTTVSRLRRMLRGDLDTIVLTAIKKEPVRRYKTAEQFSNDLHRYLEGLPIRARADRWTYRVEKFVKRNRLAVVAAGLLVGSLVAGTIGTSWQWYRANLIADRARREAETAQAINEFFVLDMIASANPTKRRENLTLDEVLRQASARIDTRFKDQPELEATIRYTLGDALLHLGDFRPALEQLEKSLTLQEDILGPDKRQTLKTRAAIGNVLDCVEEFDNAELHLRETCRQMSAALGPDDPDTLTTKALLAEVLQTIGKHEQAQSLLQSVIERLRSAKGPPSPLLATVLNSLGASYQAEGKLDQAESAFREYLAFSESNVDANPSNLANSYNQLGSLLYAQGKFESAEPLFHRTLEIAGNNLPADHPTLALYHTNRGLCLMHLGRFEEARPHIKSGYEVMRTALGEDHSNTEWTLTNLYALYYELNQPDKAEPLHIQQLQTRLRIGHLGEKDATGFRWSVDRYAKTFSGLGQTEKPQRLFDRLADYVEEQLPDDHPGKSRSLGMLGAAALEADRLDLAERLLETCAERDIRSELPPDEFAWLAGKMVDLYEQREKPEQATVWRKKQEWRDSQ